MSMPVTPQPQAKKLAEALGLKTALYLKREDLHPYGSHKGRSIPLMIKKYASQGERDFVISSSGNAALAAGLYVRDYNRQHKTDPLHLAIFIGKNIDKEKLLKLKTIKNKFITIAKTENPKQSAFLLAKMGAQLLRQSTDNLALVGYAGLYAELSKIKDLKAVFIPTSSGTTAVGLYVASKGKIPVHIVQTDACHPFVKTTPSPLLEKERAIASPLLFKEGTKGVVHSLASAIVDKVGLRKPEILEALKKSRGVGYMATNKEIKNAMALAFKTEKIKLSPNSALALVGLRQALANGWEPNGTVALLITGR
ncbi:MAG: hypothetical protein A3J93_02085 [Candidatus Magasanikbacteria bacterium RIFOXYC2_FULL_42_28]|uniref:Tryptophan synthase beta chain-like PALP domain-containing protein n=1 Tax=Candidatus Magasanikbacteria bacterium RIFOXYC2_FULL_42_28 TaxID=1798704 RepID=A0A1F6NWI3_9BACT|nr:MAG: hypothetical protein A3J93_02085 [Candidatus Magasanikbacteria bacterium RIFOXYC2_FULL_42_28]